MHLRSWHLLWKVPLAVLLMTVSVGLGGALATALGLPAAEVPAEADAATLGLLMMLANLLIVLALVAIAPHLGGGWAARWSALALFTWLAHGVNTALESSIFMTGGALLNTVVTYLPPCVVGAGAVALLFPPPGAGRSASAGELVRAFAARHSAGGWLWRLAAALVAFPVIYMIFGLLIAPVVVESYRTGVGDLALPTIGEMIPLAFLRSLLFLLACLPLMALWQASPRRFGLSAGLALFVLVGLAWQIVGYWLPTTLRLVHAGEVLADSLLYAGVLATLLLPKDHAA